jgi:hypothetical protein
VNNDHMLSLFSWWELVSTRMATAYGLVRAPARSCVRAPSSATLRLELLLLNIISQWLLPLLVSFFLFSWLNRSIVVLIFDSM